MKINIMHQSGRVTSLYPRRKTLAAALKLARGINRQPHIKAVWIARESY